LTLASSLSALPQGGEVAAGSAEFLAESNKLTVSVSDQVILNFEKFSIGKGEWVQFIQPNDKSCALSRITGGDPSQIFGSLSANGRLFLVNPNGIYFGPHASVNAGSFLASTLNIKDEDFLNGRFVFTAEPGSKAAVINEGAICASNEGFIAILAPIIENRGSIFARADKIVLASAERVALDFSGDGLIRFTVDGELEQALIENYGQIESAHGGVHLSMRTANRAIKTVVNTDGVAVATGIVEENGIIRLVAGSQVKGPLVSIEGPQVEAGGSVEGETIHLLGDRIALKGAAIDASGDLGGGTVLIGGDYQGKGAVRNATFTQMDEASTIHADARLKGDGGKVILWADDTTLFDGKIYARGGKEGGNGGFVETSGKENLGIEKGFVETSAVLGQFGMWLLDPASIVIATGGGGTIANSSAPNCATNGAQTIAPATIAASATNVALCAQRNTTSTITVTNAVTMTNAGVSLTLTAGSANAGTIALNANITTRGAAIGLTGLVTLGAAITLDTTNGGASPTGGAITFSNTVNGGQTLTLNGGTGGTVTFNGAVGGTTALTGLTVTGGAISLRGVRTNGGAMSFTGPATLNAASVLDTTNSGGTLAGAAITFSSNITGGANALTFNGGTGGAVSVGGTLAATTLTVTNSGSTTITGTTTVPTVTLTNTTGNITFNGAATIATAFTVNALGYGVVFNNGGTVTPATTFGNTGGVTLQSGASANLTFTNGFTHTAGATTLLGTIRATTAAAGVSMAAVTFSTGTSTLTTNGGAASATGAMTVTGTATIDTTNGGGTPAGGAITLSGAIDGVGNLTLTRGSGGTVSFAAVGGTTPLASFTATGATVTQNTTAETTGAIVYTGTTAINLGGDLTTNGGGITLTGPIALAANVIAATPGGGNIAFTGTITGAHTLTLTGGASSVVSFGTVSSITSLTASGTTVTQSSTAQTTGAISYTGSINLGGNITTSGATVTMTGAAALTTNVAVDTTNGSPAGAAINFTSNVTGANTLTVNSGTGATVSIGGNLSTSGFTVTNSAGTTVTGTTGVSTVTLTNTTGAITFNGAATVSTTFSTAAQGYSLIFNNGGTITPATTFINTGGVTLRSGGSASLSFTNGLTSTASTTTVLGTVKTTAAAATISLGTVTFSAGTSSLITNGGTAGVSGTMTLTGNATIDTTNSGGTPAGANITLSTVNGPGNLTLVAGTGGSIALNGVVGGGTSVGVLTISSANNVTATTITAGSIVQSAGTGTTTFNGVVNTSGSAGISLTGTNFAINANMTTQVGSGGPIIINHTGSLVIAPTAVISADGGFFDNGSGSGTTNLSGTINTNGQNLIFSNPVLLVGTASLNTGSGVGNISFLSTLNGSQNLTLAAGGGNITFTGTVGTTRLNTLTINSANNVTANALSVTVFNQTAGTGTTTFNGAVDVSGASGISFVGNNVTINSTMVTAAGGPASFQVAGTFVMSASAALSLDGAFTQSGAGSSQIAGSITTTNDNITFGGPVAFTAATVLNTGAGIGNILFSSTVDGPGAVSMTAGTGNITLTGAGGSLTRLGAVTFNSVTNLSTQGIAAASINQTVAPTGTTSFVGDLNTNAVAGIQLRGGAITVNGVLTTTNSGPFSVINTGTLSLTAGAASSLSSTFTQSGGGGVNLTGTIVTSSAAISFANAITLTGTTSLSTGAGAGDISFASTISGAQNLTLTAGTGSITFSGAVGGTRLANLTINSATNVTAVGISAATFSQLSGTGTTTLNGAVNTNAIGGVALTGAAFTINSTITTTASGPLAISNSGTLTFNSGGIASISGAFTQSNSGATALAGGQITAAGIAFASLINLSGSSQLTSTGANDLILNGTMNGAGNITLNSAQNITLFSAVGALVRVGTFTVSGGVNVSTVGITASVIAITSTGLLNVNGDLNTNGASGMTFTVNDFTRVGGFATTNGGPVTVTNTGTLTSVSSGTRSVDGFYLQQGGGPVIYSGTIQTNNQPITINSAITLFGDVTLNSGTGGGTITLAGTVNGAHILNLVAGTGDIVLGSAIGGTPLTALNFTSAHNITTSTAITAGTITQGSATGVSPLSTFAALNASAPAGIVLSGGAYTFNGLVTTTTSGPFTLTNTGTAIFGAAFSVSGALTQTGAGAVQLGANITTDNSNLSIASAITLNANVILNSGTGAGAITLSSTVNGAHTLTLTSGADNANISGAVGATTPLTTLTITGNNINIANIGTALAAGVSGTTTMTATVNLNFNGSIYNENTQSLTGNTANITAVGTTTFTTNGNPITFAGTGIALSTGANLVINSGGGAITLSPLHAGAASLRTVTLNAGAGAITVVNMGTLGNGELSSVVLNGADILIRGDLFPNSLSFTSTGSIFLGGSITTLNTALTFPVAVVRDTNNGSTVSTGSTGAALTFSSTIDSDNALTPRNLTLASGGADISVVGAIGGVVPLNVLTFSTLRNASLAAITVGNIVQSAGTGTTTFGGLVTTSSILGISLTGSGFSFTNGVDTTSGTGVLTIANTGILSINTGVIWALGGAFTQTGAGAVHLAVHIDETDSISFVGPVTLTGATILDTVAGNKSITFNNTINGPGSLTMEAGTSNIFFLGNAGLSTTLGTLTILSANNITVQSITATSLSLTGGAGTSTLNGNLITTAAGGITLVGTNFVNNGSITTLNGGSLTLTNSGTVTGNSVLAVDVDNSFTQNGSGPFAVIGSIITHTGSISVASATTLLGPMTFDSHLGNGTITFSSTINNTQNLTLAAGSGAIHLNGVVGGITPLSTLTISSAGNVNSLAISAARILQSAGTGTTTFSGALITTGALGISVTTSSVVRGGAITTTNGGPVTIAIANAGTFTSTAAGAITIDGAFAQTGTGAVAFGGSILTTNDTIAFAGPITLSADSSLSTGTSGAGAITLSSTVQGAFALSLSSGGDDITIGGAVGTVGVPLGDFTIVRARNATLQAITATAIAQQSGSGTTVFQGAISATGASGISLIGSGFTLQSNVTTAMGANLTVTNSGTFTLSSGANLSIAGNLVQNGAGASSLSGTTVTAGTIAFAGAVTATGTASLRATDQTITFGSTVDGPGSLSLNSGSSDIVLNFNAGGVVPLNVFTIANARNVATQAVTAASIVQSAGSGGTTTFNGDLNTSGSAGINLTGAAFTFLGNATAAVSSGGPIQITNSGTLTTTAGKTLSADGSFAQNESGIIFGPVNLAGNVSANNATIKFESPITLLGNVVLNSRSAGTGGANITVATVDGNFNLTFTAGATGSVFAGAIGGVTRVGTVTATSVQNITASSITAGAIIQLAGSGTTTLNGDINTNTPSGINLVGTNFFRAGAIITTNGGSVVVTNSGTITGSGINTTNIDGSYTQNGSGTGFLVGTITARQGIFLSEPILLAGANLILDTSGGNGNIVISNTLNNYIDGPHQMTLRTGTGNVTLSGAIGGTTPIGALVFGNVNNVTAAAIAAASIGQEALTSIGGLATFNGIIATTGASGIVLAGNQFVFNNNISAASTGPMTITNSGTLTLANGITVSLGGAFTQNGTGTVSTGAAISTTNQNISFATQTGLTAAVTLNSGAGAGNVTLSTSLVGAFPLTINAGTGTVNLPRTGLSTPLTALTVGSASSFTGNSTIAIAGPIAITSTGAATFSDTVTTTGGSGTIAINNGGTLTVSNTVTSSQSFIQTQTGTPAFNLNANITTVGTLQADSDITLSTNISLNSGGGALTLSGAVNSDSTPRNLTLTAGAGAITLGGTVGGVNPVNVFQIVNGASVTAANISAASIQQLAGAGLNHYAGTLTTTALAGISLTGAQFTLDDTVTTTNVGPLTIVHTGLLTLNAPSMTHSISGPFSESGGGAVSTAASLTTSAQNITFGDAVTLTGPVTYTSGNGNIVFSGTIDGPFCLTLVAGTGAIQLNAAVGSSVNLGCLTASGATIFQNSILSTGAVQETGAITLNGGITTSATNITLTGNVISQNSPIALSTGGGAGTIHITGTLNPDVGGRNFSLLTGTSGTVTLDSAVGGTNSFNNFTVNTGTFNVANFGSTVSGASGTTSFTAATNINFTGTTYRNGVMNFTAGTNFNFNAGALTTITSSGSAITFATGTIQLAAATDLTINSNGGNVTLTDTFGSGRTLNITADLGTVTVAHIGTMGQPLSAINVTSAILNAPFTTFPGITFTPTAAQMIGVSQLDPTNFNSPVLITADNITFSFTTCPGGNSINFNSTLDSDSAGAARNITFNMCGNTLTFNNAVGGTTPLSSITVNNDTGVVFNSTITVGAYLGSTGQGGATTVFNNGLNIVAGAGTSLNSGVDITSPNITLKGNIAVASGDVILNNSVTLLATATNIDIANGTFSQTGAGPVTISGNVDTVDNTIQFHGPMTLSGDMILSTIGPLGSNSAGANITLDSTTDGAFNLTFAAGIAGTVTAGVMGGTIPLNAVLFMNNAGTTLSSISASTITQTTGTGTFSLVGTFTTTGAGGINVAGVNFSRAGSLVTTNGGNLVVTNSGTVVGFPGNTTNIDGAYIQNGSSGSAINFAGTITAKTGISFTSPLSLVGDGTLTTTAGNGPIVLSATLNGLHAFTINAGTGDVTLSSVIGGSVPIGALTLGAMNNLSAVAISADSIQNAVATTIAGTATFNGDLTTTGTAGIVVSGNQLVFSGNITTGGTGPLTIANAGALSFAAGKTYSIAGAFGQSGGGAVSYAGAMSASDVATAISFTDPITLAGVSSFSAASGDIAFASTINGGQNLDLTATTGAITFGGNLGATLRLGALVIHNTAGITYPSVTALSISQLANSGTTTITGPLSTPGAAGISLIGGVFAQNGLVTTTGTGSYTVRHSGTYTMAANIAAAGGFTDSASSSGGFTINGTITTANNNIAFAGSGAITLGGAAVLNTGSGAGNITFATTVDGAQALTLTAGTGSITFSANVGVATARIGALTINTANNVTATQIRAASITQNAGSGLSNFQGALNATTTISLIGTAITIGSTTVTGAGNSVTIANSGTFTLTGSISPGSGGSFNQTGTGSSSLSGAVTTAGIGTIAYQGPVVIPALATSTQTTANHTIIFHNTVDGPGSLTLVAGSQDISLEMNAGSLSSLNVLTITSARNFTTQAVTAASVLQSAGTGTTTFNSNVTTSAVGGIDLTSVNLTFVGNATTAAVGPIHVVNAGALTLSPNMTVSVSGDFNQSGGGTVNLGSNVSTNDQALTFTDPITLTAPVTLNSHGGDIAIGTADGNFNLTFDAGATGTVTAGVIGGGTPVATVVFVNNAGTLVSDISALSITQTTGTGTFSIVGTFTTTGSAGINLTGVNFSRAGSLVTQNGGNLVVTNSGTITGFPGNTTSIDGAYIQNGSSGAAINFAGTITARTGISFTSPVSLSADGTLTTTGNGPIVLSGTINGGHVFTVNAGAGDVTFSQPIGASVALTTLNLTGSDIFLANIGTSLAAGVTGSINIPASLTPAPDTINFTSTNYNANTQNYTANLFFNMNGGALTTIQSSSDPIVFTTGTIQLAAGTNLTINSVSGATGGAITTAAIHAGASSGRSLIISAGTGIMTPGTVTVGTIGTAGNGEFALASLTGTLILQGDIVANTVTLTPTGTINISGNITTTNTTLTFPTAVKLNASKIFSTGSGAGNIVFATTLDGDADNSRNLTLAAGTGNITFTGAVGATHALNVLTISSATLATAHAISAVSLSQSSGSGTFLGAIATTGVAGITLTGSAFEIDDAVSTANNASLIVNQTGTFTFAGTATISGAFTQSGSGSTALSGSVTAGQLVSFAGQVNLSGTPSIDTSAANQDITFSNFVQGPGDLTLASGEGNILFSGAAGSTTVLGAVVVTNSHNITLQNFTATSFNLMASSGTATLGGALTTTGASGIILVGTNFFRGGAITTTGGGSFDITNAGLSAGNSPAPTTISGSYTQHGTNPFNFGGQIIAGGNISFEAPLTLLGITAFNTSSGGGTITLSNTVDGAQPIFFTAGAGTVILSSPIGATTRVGAITINSAATVNAVAITAASITQSAGSGTTTFSGDLNTNGAIGIVLSGTNFVRGANWTTTNSGPITITNTGTFTSTAAGTINSSGAFRQLGSGGVTISRTVNTSNADILLSGPVTLGSGGATFNSGSGAGSITFASSVDAAQPLTLTSGTGDILFQGAVGSGIPIGVLTVIGAANVTVQSLTAASILQASGSGTTTLNGPTNTNALAGIHFIGNAMTLNNTVTTTTAGPLLIENSGLLTVNATCSIAGAFTQHDIGPSIVSGSITSTGSTVSFAGPLTTSGTASLITTSQPITIANTLNGPGNINFTAGAGGDISLAGITGGLTRLGALQFNTARNITTSSITALSITQSSGAGTTSLLGDLNTSGVSGINLIGTIFRINGNIVTTSLGPLAINHAGLLTLNPGVSTLIAGPFTETGGSTVSLSGDLHTNSADITFTRPINLIAPTRIDSDGSGDILISNTVDGNTDLVLNAGPATIQATAVIGGTTPLNSLTIESAGDATFIAISAGSIAQLAGTGLTSFNGVLTTTQPAGIVLAGNQFTFQAAVNTTGNGPVQITNIGLLTLESTATMTLTGAFLQLGSGPVSLSDNITSDNDPILFTGPVTLGNASILSTSTASGDISFLSTLDGTQNLTLSAGQGSILFAGAVGAGAPLSALSFASHNFTSASITAASITSTAVSGLATFNGTLTTTGTGIDLTGAAFTFNGNTSVTGGGSFTLTNSGAVTFGPSISIAVDSFFLQDGTGLININGTLTTANNDITFQSPLLLNGNFTVNSGSGVGDISFQSDLDGLFNLTLLAGTGDISFTKAIGDGGVLNNFSASANNINLAGVGTLLGSGAGSMTLTATNAINLTNNVYSAASQIYSAGTNINFNTGALVTLNSFGGPIAFTSGAIILSTQNDLAVITNGGSFSYVSISGTTFENIDINTGSGIAFMNLITSPIHINNLNVSAGQIELLNELNATNVNFISRGAIFNAGAQFAINSTNTASFNALGGDVGTLSSPILVNTSNQIFAGSTHLADFDGTASDNTIHSIPSNPPCLIIFNGIIIKPCNPVIPSGGGGGRGGASLFASFAMADMEDSQFNLASDYFFLPFYLDNHYFIHGLTLYYTLLNLHVQQ
jgi:hypothetical protein